MHPFREGNGRTQREFLKNIAKINNYELSFRNISNEEMIEISINKDMKILADKFNEGLSIKSKKIELKKHKEQERER